MRNLRSIPALGAFFVLLALLVSACGSDVPGNSVAVVAGNPITTRAFDHWMYVAAKGQAAQAPGQPVIVPNDPPSFDNCLKQVRAQIPALKKTPDKTIKADCKALFKSMSAQVMDFLIRAYWYQADAHRLGIKVTDAQVEKALAAARKSSSLTTQAQFTAFLKSSGMTMADVMYRFRIQQTLQKLLARHSTKVTSAQITAYYNSHKSQFGTPQTRNLKIVLTKTVAQASAAKAALKSGQSWAAVAKKYSIDPTTKTTGGVLNNVTKGQEDAALSNAAFSAPLNKLVGPVKGQFGYYLVEVTKITPATQRSLAQSSTQIKQILQQQAQSQAQSAVDSHAKRNWQSKTKCRPLYAMADCSGYKAPKSSSSTTAG